MPADESQVGAQKGRVIGIDLGSKRIGIAVSDSNRTQAFARTIIERSGDEELDRRALVAAISDAQATIVVVGLPLSLDGSRGIAARRALVEIARLEQSLEIPVFSFDERLTTVEAQRRRRLVQDASEKTRARKGASTKRRVDDLAAEVMLQAYLDRELARR